MIEIELHNLIKELYQEIKDMKPADGFSSPRDLDLVNEVNIKNTVLDKLQDAMRVLNPLYEIKEN